MVCQSKFPVYTVKVHYFQVKVHYLQVKVHYLQVKVLLAQPALSGRTFSAVVTI